MLVNLKTILSGAREGGYAVGLFNCVTLEMTRGIIAAAEELRSPVIIGPGESLLPGASLPDYADMMLGIARRASVPVAVHFDHGFTPELVEEAISLGFTSVMYDCSMLSFEENVRRIREMAKKAHAAGCSLEAEIGHVGSNGSAEEDIARCHNDQLATPPGVRKADAMETLHFLAPPEEEKQDDTTPNGIVSISAKTGEGLDRLLSAIDKKLDKGTKRVTLHLPYDKAGALDSLYREAKVESVEYGETVDVVAVCTPRIIGQLKNYIEGWTEPKEEWE